MIKAVFYKKNGGLSGFSLSGHAGWGESGSDGAAAGSGVVCASVSSAAELVCNTVTDFFNDEAEVSVLENKLALKLKSGSENSRRLLESFYAHLGLISEEFPGCIRIIIEREATNHD